MTAKFEHEVIDRLARIEVKVDSFGKKLDSHEDRIGKLERRNWIVIGLSLAISAVSPQLASKLGF